MENGVSAKVVIGKVMWESDFVDVVEEFVFPVEGHVEIYDGYGWERCRCRKKLGGLGGFVEVI